jgi:hypothetical protein
MSMMPLMTRKTMSVTALLFGAFLLATGALGLSQGLVPTGASYVALATGVLALFLSLTAATVERRLPPNIGAGVGQRSAAGRRLLEIGLALAGAVFAVAADLTAIPLIGVALMLLAAIMAVEFYAAKH